MNILSFGFVLLFLVLALRLLKRWLGFGIPSEVLIRWVGALMVVGVVYSAFRSREVHTLLHPLASTPLSFDGNAWLLLVLILAWFGRRAWIQNRIAREKREERQNKAREQSRRRALPPAPIVGTTDHEEEDVPP